MTNSDPRVSNTAIDDFAGSRAIATRQPPPSSSKRDSESPIELQWDVELDAYVVRLEQAYANGKSNTGTNPIHVEIIDYCPVREHPQYETIVRELIRVDMELASSSTGGRGIDYYRQRFGSLLDQESICRELEFEENRLQLRNSDSEHADSKLPTEFPKVGQDVCGFKILSELGRGSFGRVYVASELGLANRRVVLKVSSQFPGEAQLLSKLQHKNIVPIYSLHRHDQCHVVCMPLLGVATLATLLSNFQQSGETPSSGRALIDSIKNCNSETWPLASVSSSSLTDSTASTSPTESVASRATKNEQAAEHPVDRINSAALDRLQHRFEGFSYARGVLWVISQIADGLAHAHERGILHRDIKPANVLVSDDGVPMLLDFNLASDSALVGSPSEIVFGGTPRYMAPEQLTELVGNSKLSDQRSDLYSLGLVAFELLALQSPFPNRSGTSRRVLEQMCSDRQSTPKIPVHAPQGVSSGMQAILTKLLQYSPSSRYQNAQELLEDIDSELNHRSLKHASGESLADRVRKWNRRHPRLSATTLVATISAVFLSVATLGLLFQHERVKQLTAVKWLTDAKSAISIAQGLLSTADLAPDQVDSMIETCSVVIDRRDSVQQASLTSLERSQANEVLSQLLMLRARGNTSLAMYQGESTSRLVRLRSAREDASLSAKLLTNQANLAATLDSAIDEALKSDDPTQFRRILQEQLQLSPDQVQSAIDSMQKSIGTDAENPWYWTNLAQLQLASRNLKAARTNLEVALSLKSQLPWPSLMLATLELDQHRYGPAKQLLDQTIQLDQQSTAARLNRAIANVGLGNLAAALEDLNAIESQANENPRILFVRELVYRRLGQQAKADQDRQVALAIEPRDARSWNSRGEAKLRLLPPDALGALEDFRQASVVTPSLRNSYENMATVLSEYLKRPEEAIQALDQAIACDEEYALAWSGRSVLKARLGRAEAAVEDANRALAMDRDPMVCYQAASTFALLRRSKADERIALDLLKETARRNPALAELMESDADLNGIQDRQALLQLIAAARSLK